MVNPTPVMIQVVEITYQLPPNVILGHVKIWENAIRVLN